MNVFSLKWKSPISNKWITDYILDDIGLDECVLSTTEGCDHFSYCISLNLTKDMYDLLETIVSIINHKETKILNLSIMTHTTSEMQRKYVSGKFDIVDPNQG